ncbi:hypothetical protein V8G54_002545 [Vigna mungo]|uniref:Metallo-beta-lactamase domain-containing protein n=1 Tax=Vigna mungo TaxID=3915 RepID=A0AAQ3SCP0_VIGMU
MTYRRKNGEIDRMKFESTTTGCPKLLLIMIWMTHSKIDLERRWRKKVGETFPPTLHTSKLLASFSPHVSFFRLCSIVANGDGNGIGIDISGNGNCLIEPSDPPCSVCTQSLSLPPQSNPNYRCNTSLLINYYSQTDATHKYILIDAGKTFRESVLRWFVFHRIPRVDSILLTHDHADAILGLDDIRAVQPFSPTNDIDPTPVYLTQRSMER